MVTEEGSVLQSLRNRAGRMAFGLARHDLIQFAACVVLLCLLVAASGSYYIINLSANVGILYILAVAMVLLLRYSDQMSLAQGALWGVGAYAVGIAQVHLGMGQVASFVIGIAASSVMGLIVALPLIRLRRHFLAMATLAFQLIFMTVVVQTTSVTGGSSGLVGLSPISIGGVEFYDELFLIPLAVGVLIVYFVFRNATRYRHGRAAVAIRSDELMAESVGVLVGRSRVYLFVVASAMTGLAGYLQAVHSLILTPPAFNLQASVTLLAMVVIGGSGAVVGPILGVAIYYLSTQLLAQWPDYQAVLFGVVIVAVMRWMPEGVSGSLRQLWVVLRRRRRGAPASVAVGSRNLQSLSLRPSPSGAGQIAEEVRAAHGVPVLEIEGVDKSFDGVSALKGVSLVVPPEGGVTAVIGPNGAGKSTLFNVINGIFRADRGVVRLFGQDIATLPPAKIARLGVGRSFQNPRLLEDEDCLTNVMLGAHRLESYGRARNYSGLVPRGFESWNRARSLDILRFLGLGDVASLDVNQLPFGARKILELGRILNMSPRLLLLDEPGAGLNDEEGAWLGSVLLDLARAGGIPVVIVDHRLDLIRQIADRVVVLNQGQVLARGGVDDVLCDPRVIEAYLGAVLAQDEL